MIHQLIRAHCVLAVAALLLAGCSLHVHSGKSIPAAADSETRNIVGTYRATHKDWKGQVILEPDGIFRTTKQGVSRGTWRLEQSVLLLLWYDYRPDSLVMLEHGKRFSCPYYKFVLVRE